MNIPRAKEILTELVTKTEGNIHPVVVDGERKVLFPTFIVVKPKTRSGELYDEETEKLLEEYVDCICTDDRKGFYHHVMDFATKKWEEYEKREKMYYIYKTQIGIDKKDMEGNVVGEQRINLYDMSVLKIQAEVGGMYADESYFKSPPDWIIDIKRFTTLIVPINFGSVMLMNPEERCVIDMKTDKVFNIPIESKA